MGLLELVKGAVKGRLKPKLAAKGDLQCPKCKTKVTLEMERCPGCGTRISSMFRIECPKCKEPNPLTASACSKCGASFVAQQSPPQRETYVCPICGYRADYFMLSCPSCGVKFVS